mmetsp:Transcript_13881/g.12595  ORF Transcript_13881/g.12595 Transcript_13881/m.12595 type:complete len:124 (-) Transcript_13881:65-436(-)
MGRTRNKITRATKNKAYKKSHDTKRRPKDIDQIQDDIKYINDTGKSLTIEPNEDLPGLGQHYCLTCARHFMNENTLNIHTTTKAHKRRLKDVAIKQYTQTEAELAAGKSIEILPPAHNKMSVE